MKLILRYTVTLGILLVGLTAKAQVGKEIYDSVQRLQEQGKLKVARALLQQDEPSLTSEARAAKHYALLGSVCEDQGYLIPALEAYQKSREIASHHKQPPEMAAALNGIARIETALGHSDSITNFLNESGELDTTARNRIIIDQAEGKYWQSQNQYDKALSSLQHALDLAMIQKDEKNIAVILSSIGSIYFSHNPDMHVALDFYRRSNNYSDSLNPSSVRIRNYCRIANSYMVMGDLKKAETYLQLARQLTKNTEHLPLKAYVLSTWAILLSEQGKIKEAADFSAEPIRIKRELGDSRQLQSDLLNVGEMRMMIGEYDQARKLLTEGTAISHSLHDIVFLKYFYQKLSDLDSMTGNYRAAYTNLKRSFAYKDSTFSVDLLRAVNEIKEKYETEQKEKIIAGKELQIEAQKYQRAIILGACITSILTLLVILIVIRSKNRSKLQHEKHLRLHTIVQTQEEVQQRIARDLHDGLVQVLAAAQMSLESVRDHSDLKLLQKQMHIASGILDEAATEARSISHQVLPYSLLKGGLVEALEELLARSFENYTFNKKMDRSNLNESEAINLYRIVQELVNNVRKHAQATRVVLTLESHETEIHLIFEDNGKGFNALSPSAGVGLSNMKTRAELMRGVITFRSELSKGTRVELLIRR